MDLISIIIPVYGVEDYLDRCVASVCTQTYSNLEIILVDDGSKDSCPQICDIWAGKDERIKVIHKTNGGLSDARNAGLSLALGNYIVFVDSDDMVDRGFIQGLYETMKETGSDICECGVRYIDEDDKVLRVRSYPEEIVTFSRVEAISRLIKEEGIYQTVWNKLYKRKVIEGIWFPVGKHHEDDFWTYRIFDRIEFLTVIGKPLYDYRQRNASIMGVGYTIKRLDGIEARIRRMKYFENDHELGPLVKARIQYDYLFHLQCVLTYLKGMERNQEINFLLDQIKQLKSIDYKDSGVTLKYQLWFFLFRHFPVTVARIRNKLKIGV